MKTSFLLCAFGILLFGFSSRAHAENKYAGIFIGPSFVNQDVGSHASYGIRAGIFVNPYFRLGIYGSYTNLGAGILNNRLPAGFSVSGSQKRYVAAVEGEVFPVPGIDFFMGGKVGAAFESYPYLGDGSGANFTQKNSTVHFAIAPTLGYLYRLNDEFSLGIEASYLVVSNSSASDLNSFDLLGSVTFEF